MPLYAHGEAVDERAGSGWMSRSPGDRDVVPGLRIALWFPFPGMTLPRTTSRSWWARSKRFMDWRDRFRAHLRDSVQVGLRSGDSWVALPARLWVGVNPKGIRSNSDLSNLLKAVEDSVVGVALPDDCVRVLRDTRAIASEDFQIGGFSVLLESLEA